jgi:hypothetical protein
MSHLVQIQTQVREASAVAAACQRLHLPPPRERTVSLFRATVHGLAVELPDWRYPVVCDLARGRLQYDHFGGRWGDEAHLHRFLQAYAVEQTKQVARRQGYTATERLLADGSIHLQLVTS